MMSDWPNYPVNHRPGNELNVCSGPEIGDTPEKIIREKHGDTDLFTVNEDDK